MSAFFAVLLPLLVATQIFTRVARDRFEGFSKLPHAMPGS